MDNAILTKRPSSNRKTGPVYCIYRPLQTTCPTECPISKFCYGASGPVYLAAKKSLGQKVDLEKRFAKLRSGTRVRHNVVGDFFINNEIDTDFIDEVRGAHEKFPTILGWGYTHGWRRIDPALLTLPNLIIRASCETDADVELAHKLGWKTARAVPPSYAKGPGEVFCQNETRGRQCVSCNVCMHAKRTVLFTAHGVKKESLSRFLKA